MTTIISIISIVTIVAIVAALIAYVVGEDKKGVFVVAVIAALASVLPAAWTVAVSQAEAEAAAVFMSGMTAASPAHEECMMNYGKVKSYLSVCSDIEEISMVRTATGGRFIWVQITDDYANQHGDWFELSSIASGYDWTVDGWELGMSQE